MKLGFRLMTGAALSLGLLAGDISQASPLASAASAQDYYRGGHDYHGRSNGHVDAGALLFGAAVIGGIAAIASSSNRNSIRSYNDGYGGGYVQPNTGYGQYGQSQYGESEYGQPGYGREQYGQAQYGYGQDARQYVIAQCSVAAERAAQARGLDARVTRIFDVDDINGGGRVAGAIQFRINNGYGDDDDRVQQQRFRCTAQYGRITSLRFG